ncbi:MAG: Brix domain-containing protein [Methanobacterium sp.]
MFITTSRKPSAKTRTFCQSVSRALGAEYVNRGKMSFRDILIKAGKFKHIAIISQVKGNPSRIEFYNQKGEILLTFYIKEAMLNLKGRINPNKLTLRSDIEELTEPLLNILEIMEDHENSNENLLWIKKGRGDIKAVFEFYGKDGSMVNPKIYVRRFE